MENRTKIIVLLAAVIIGAFGLSEYLSNKAKAQRAATERENAIAAFNQSQAELKAKREEAEAKKAAEQAAERGQVAIEQKKAKRVASVKDAFSKVLLDPESLQLRQLTFSGVEVCGEFNSKNRMGGYVGFDKFHWDGVTLKTVMHTEELFKLAQRAEIEDRCRAVTQPL